MFPALLIFIASLFPVFEQSASHPVILSEFSDFDGGRIVISEDSSKARHSFYLKPNWGAEEEVMYAWHGIEKSSAAGLSLGNSFILDAYPIDGKLFTVESENLAIKCKIYDKNLKTISKVDLPVIFEAGTAPEVEIAGRCSENTIVLRINNFLIYVENIDFIPTYKVIDDKISKCAISKTEGEKCEVLGLSIENRTAALARFDFSGMFLSSTPVQPGKTTSLTVSNDYYGVSGQSDAGHVFLQLFSKSNHKLVATKRIKTRSELLTLTGNNEIAYITKREDTQIAVLAKISGSGLEIISEEELPSFLVSPVAVEYRNNNLYCVFRQGLVIFNKSFSLTSALRFSYENNFSGHIEIFDYPERLVISSAYFSKLLSKKENKSWLLNKLLYESRYYIIPFILLLLLIISIRLNSHYKRQMHTILNLDSTGVIYMINAKGYLTKANDAGKGLIGTGGWSIRKKHYSYYLKKDSTILIYRFLVRAVESRTNLSDKITLKFGDDEREWLCTAAVLRNVAGAYRGVIFSGIDITEQLEKKRLTNWAQLAHDMQTNLSTIRLNGENIEPMDQSTAKAKSAILNQTSLLIKRVRDIVTVGRREEIALDKQSSEEICREAVSEFDETMFPNVKFIVEPDDFRVYCDRQRMVRAVRNAIENGIKAMPDRTGTIRVGSIRESNNAIFSIKDTGKGMDQTTIQKMLKPYFTTAKEKGGHGIGTMIIQKVIELHGGEIKVLSEPGKGTEIRMIIPNIKRKIKN
jgi:signal transduction histidine kinase